MRKALQAAALRAFHVRAARVAPKLPHVRIEIVPGGVTVLARADGRIPRDAARHVAWPLVSGHLMKAVEECIAEVTEQEAHP